jgi:hypothetical protein
MKIAIATPCYGGYTAQFLDSIEHAKKCIVDAGDEGTILRINDSALMEQNRSLLAMEALNQSADVLLFWDADIYVDGSWAPKIAQEAFEHGIVGALCPTKRPQGNLCSWFPEGTRIVDCYQRGKLYLVNAIGMGFTAIAARVFAELSEKLPLVSAVLGEKVYPFFRSEIRNGSWYGEDYSFCLRARDAGFIPHVDTRIRVIHEGKYGYRLEDTGIFVPKLGSMTINLDTKSISPTDDS